jgi:transposase
MGNKYLNEAIRTQAVAMVLSEGCSVRAVCEQFGVGPTAVRRWIREWRAVHEAPLPTAEEASADKQRIRELESRIGRLEGERELLKKSIAFFVRESDHSTR